MVKKINQQKEMVRAGTNTMMYLMLKCEQGKKRWRVNQEQNGCRK